MLKLMFLSVAISLLSLGTVMAQSNSSIESDIHELVNKYRAKNGLPALEIDATISAAAAKHSRNMASRKIPPGHSGFDERMNKLMKQLKGSNACAENVAYGAKDAESVVEMWIDSKGHRKNILGDYNYTGIAVARSKDGTLYFTQIFIRRK